MKEMAVERVESREISKRGVHEKYFRKTLKRHNVEVLKNCYRTKIVNKIQIYYKLSFCFKRIFEGKNNYL